MVPVRQVAHVGVAAIRSARLPSFRTLEDAHLPQAIEDRALDAVVGKGKEVGADLRVEALGRLEQPDLPIRDELVHLEGRVELLTHLCRQAPDVGPVLGEDFLAAIVKAQSYSSAARPHRRSSAWFKRGSSCRVSAIFLVSAFDWSRTFSLRMSATSFLVASSLVLI